MDYSWSILTDLFSHNYYYFIFHGYILDMYRKSDAFKCNLGIIARGVGESNCTSIASTILAHSECNISPKLHKKTCDSILIV